MTTNQENKQVTHKTGPIDLDTCEPWETEDSERQEEPAQEPTINKKPTKASSQPFGSNLKQLIKFTTSKRFSRSKKHDANKSIDSDTSMSSAGQNTTFDIDEDQNELPIFQYKEHSKSPLLKNTDTSVYDNRLISSIAMENNSTAAKKYHYRSTAKPLHQYRSLDGVVAL
ncbi:MAG: hypothetical protein SGBAC_009030 [Bacillariaceae sp.]